MPGFPVTNGIETFSKPPDGYVVDFDNPKRQLVLEHYLVFAIGSPLAMIALAQRFYTKIWLANGLHIDDGTSCIPNCTFQNVFGRQSDGEIELLSP